MTTEQRLDDVDRRISLLITAIDQLRLRQEISQAQIDQLHQEMRINITDVVTMIGTLAQSVETYRQDAEADRAEIRRIWEYLLAKQRNGSNGEAQI